MFGIECCCFFHIYFLPTWNEHHHLGTVIDTLSLPYMQGTDLSEQVVGWIKPSLPLLHRPLQVMILGRGCVALSPNAGLT